LGDQRAAFKRVAVEAALKSGRLIKNSVGKVRSLTYKGKTNIVTDVDASSEKIIMRAVSGSFPDHAILSEEAGAARNGSAYRWVIDPLDGTTNFAHGFPFFCVSIALELRGEIMLGVVYDPVREELFLAEKGRGAHLNGRRIKASAERSLSRSFLATGFAYDVEKASNSNLKNFRNFLIRSMAIRRAGSAALDLSYVACGRFDGFWEIGLHPWDSAAGALLVKEAGGRVTRFDGSRFTHYDDRILATNGLIHSQMSKVLISR
jgi:myo-inositol-1(or 4)-monophosphatase